MPEDRDDEMNSRNETGRRKPSSAASGKGAAPATPEPGQGLHPEVVRRIEGYTPRNPPSHWHATLRPFVVKNLYAARPPGAASVEQWAWVLTLISEWCVGEGIPLDVERVLDPDTVERFASTGLRDFPSRYHYRTVLRRLGRLLTTEAPWEPRPERMTRRKVALPYSPSDLNLIWQDAGRQSTPSRRRAATALVCLGAGAGLDGRWSTKVKGSDVRPVDGVVVVLVPAPRPREVPVLARFEEDLLRLAAEAGEEPLVGGGSPHRNRAWKLVSRFEAGHHHPTLSLPRLRSTWLVEHLISGTRIPELLAAAGTSQIEPFDELLELVSPLDDAEFRHLLRGPE